MTSMLFATNDMKPPHGAPKTRAATEAVSSFGEATNYDDQCFTPHCEATHYLGNNRSTAVPVKGGCSKTHANKSIAAPTTQMKMTDGVSLRPDTTVPKRMGKREESRSCEQLLNTACLQTNSDANDAHGMSKLMTRIIFGYRWPS